MKIFVTGSAGFLGSWLVEALLHLDHNVVSVDSFVGGYPDNVVVHPWHQFVVMDVARPENVGALAGLMQSCDVVYHCAALAYEGLSVFSPAAIATNIVGGAVTIGSAAVEANVPRVCFLSSMARYGHQTVPFYESMTPQPVDPYGLAKVAAEDQLKLLARVHGFDLVIAVPHNIIGPRQRYCDPHRNVASIMINIMLQGRQPIIYGDGEQRRCFSFIGDVLSTLVQFIDCDIHELGEVFNVGPDEDFITINELAKRIAALVGVDCPPRYFRDRPCEVKLATCSSDKIRERFDYKTHTTLDHGLQTIVDYIKSRGVRSFDYTLPIELSNSPKLPQAWKERLL